MNLAELYGSPQRRRSGGNINLSDAIHAMVPGHQGRVASRRARDQAQDQFDESMDFNQEEADKAAALDAERLAMDRRIAEEQADQAETANWIQAGTAGLTGLYLAKDAIGPAAKSLAGLYAGKGALATAATPVAETGVAVAAETALTSGGGGVAGMTPAGAGLGGAGAGTAGSLATMAAANTAATGGVVGGAPIAGLAAAEASAAGTGAGAAGVGAGAGLAAAAPYIPFVLAAAYILNKGVFNRQESQPFLGSRDVLAASEGADLIGGRWKPTIVEQNGNRYLLEPGYKEKTGQDKWINLSDEKLMDRHRERYSREAAADSFRGVGREELQAFEGIQAPFGRDADPRQMALYDLRRTKPVEFAGKTSGEISKAWTAYRDKYKKLMFDDGGNP